MPINPYQIRVSFGQGVMPPRQLPKTLKPAMTLAEDAAAIRARRYGSEQKIRMKPRETKSTKNTAAILAVIASGAETVADMRAFVGMGKATIRATIAILIADGRVIARGKNKRGAMQYSALPP